MANDAAPAIVAGPILRRAEEGEVVVWIATSFDPSAGLLLNIMDVSTPYREVGLPALNELKTVRVGERLYISLVSAWPDAKPPQKGAFPRGKLLAYELWFTVIEPPGVERRVELKDLVDPYDELVYKGVGKPSFYLQGDEQLLLLHGSCRRPDGRGSDALTAADTLIGSTPRDLTARPALMLFTGDQIYANSPHGETLHQIHTARPLLFDYDEQVPSASGMQALGSLSDIRAKSKRTELAKKAGLNADRWPLFGLGEMVIMHLLSWHGALWAGFYPRTVPDSAEGMAGLQEINNFIVGLPAVQRALANSAVYMIFDDHEVTDDWNLHLDWKDTVEKSPLGRRTIANALAAYWLCQGWGNDPQRFDKAFVQQVQDYCDLQRSSAGKVDAARGAAFEKFMLDFHDWIFITPTVPPVFVLDTRTQRELFPRGRAPKLLNISAWNDFIDQSTVKGAAGFGSRKSRVNMKQGDPLFIVAPTPVFGMLFTEAMDKRDLLNSGPEGPDFEHWRFNQQAHHDFIKGLIKHFAPRYGVFLSGDVHTSFTAEVDYMLRAKRIDSDPQPSLKADLPGATRFYQFTSSPLKNENHAFGAQIDTTSRIASEVSSLVFGIDMWESWDLVGYNKHERNRAAGLLQQDKNFNPVYARLYVQLMDGQAPFDPFVTPTALVAQKLQSLNLGVPLWREVGRYYRHFKKSSDDAPMYPYANIGLVKVTSHEIQHNLYSVKKQIRLMPTLNVYPYTSRLPR